MALFIIMWFIVTWVELLPPPLKVIAHICKWQPICTNVFLYFKSQKNTRKVLDPSAFPFRIEKEIFNTNFLILWNIVVNLIT